LGGVPPSLTLQPASTALQRSSASERSAQSFTAPVAQVQEQTEARQQHPSRVGLAPWRRDERSGEGRRNRIRRLLSVSRPHMIQEGLAGAAACLAEEHVRRRRGECVGRGVSRLSWRRNQQRRQDDDCKHVFHERAGIVVRCPTRAYGPLALRNTKRNYTSPQKKSGSDPNPETSGSDPDFFRA